MNQLNKEEYTTGASTADGNSLDFGDRRISTDENRGKSHYGKWFGCILALALGWYASATPADPSQRDNYRYQYISLTDIPVPPGFGQFIPTAIDDSGRGYGFVYNESGEEHVAVYTDGALKVLQPGYPVAVNARGTIGGWIRPRPPQTGELQAALFRGIQVELIPYRPGETRTIVVSLNDSDTALVSTEDFPLTYRLYKNGKTTFSYQLPIESGGGTGWGVNNAGIVSGWIFDPNLNAGRAIRFRKPYGKPELLSPFSTNTDSSSFGINNSGYILGLSYDSFGDSTKFIGIWDQKGTFKTYFESSIFYTAHFNDKNLIVVTENYDTLKSYLVPSPGVRLNVEDLLVNPADMQTQLLNVVDINNHGDMIGIGLYDEAAGIFPTFLLKRLPPKCH